MHHFEKAPDPAAESPESVSDLVARFQEADQAAMYDRSWNPDDPGLMINLLIEQIRSCDEAQLSEQEREDKHYALWLWNHHAISAAIFRSHDKAAALRYAHTAARYEDGHNKITELFVLLLSDKVDEAERYVSAMSEGDLEKQTAIDLLQQSKRGEWFPTTPGSAR